MPARDDSPHANRLYVERIRATWQPPPPPKAEWLRLAPSALVVLVAQRRALSAARGD